MHCFCSKSLFVVLGSLVLFEKVKSYIAKKSQIKLNYLIFAVEIVRTRKRFQTDFVIELISEFNRITRTHLMSK